MSLNELRLFYKDIRKKFLLLMYDTRNFFPKSKQHSVLKGLITRRNDYIICYCN